MMRGVSSMDLSGAMGETSSNGQLRSKHLEPLITSPLASSSNSQCLTAAHALVTRGIERSDSEKTLILGEEIEICPMPFKPSAALDKFKVQAQPDTCLNTCFFEVTECFFCKTWETKCFFLK